MYTYGSSPSSGQEPRLDRPAVADALDPSTALREPDVAETTAEQTALPLVIRNDSERPEALVDGFGVDALAVVGAYELVLPAPKRRQVGATQGSPPAAHRFRVGRPDPQLDPARSLPAAAIAPRRLS